MFTVAIKDETFCIRDKETFMVAVSKMFDEMLLDKESALLALHKVDENAELFDITGFEDKEELKKWLQDASDYGILNPGDTLKYSLAERVNADIRDRSNGTYLNLDDVFDRIDCLEEAIESIYYTAEDVR